MFRPCKIIFSAVVLALVPATALAASGVSRVPGVWQKLPPAPSAVLPGTSLWTGKQLIVFGRPPFKPAVVAERYDPATSTWSRLSPPSTLADDPGCCKSVWTGKEMLVFGASHAVAFNPATGSWRGLRKSILGGIVVWTGREAIGWGGGCCGDARSTGAAYNPSDDIVRNLPRSPLAPSQSPLGAWTGRELILLVSGFDPDGKPYPARLARAAAYNPTTNKWRRIATPPERGGAAAWDGRELLVVGAGQSARSTLAYNPATNRWRRLASIPSVRFGASTVWTGKRLYVWGGQDAGASTSRPDGAAYDPRTNRWLTISRAPMAAGVGGSLVTWTGRSLIVWGGEIGTPKGTAIPPKFPRGGAVFTPAG
jgi:hypothetical protein